MTMSARLAASSALSTVKPSAFAFAADFDVACSPTTTLTALSRRFSACACPWLPYPMIATVRPLRRDMSASLSYQIVAISGPSLFEGEGGFGRCKGTHLARIDDVVHVDEPHQLLSKKTGCLAVRFRCDRELRRAPLSPFEEKAANGRALPAEDRLHPRQQTGYVLDGDFENLFHCLLPLRSFFSALLLRALRGVLRVLDHHRVDGLAGGPHRIAVLGGLGEDVHERRPIGHGKRPFVHGVQLVGPPHREARGSESLGELREVGVPERHGGEAAVVEELLPLPHHAEALVVEDDDLQRQMVFDGRGEGLHRLLEAAVAVEVDDEPVRPPALRAERGRQAEAHRAEPARRDERAGLVALPELSGPHLVLTHVRRDDRAQAAREPPEPVDRELREDDVAFLPVLEGRLRLPRLDLLPPVRRIGRADERKKLLEHGARVAVERVIGFAVLADLGIVDGDVDALSVRRERGELARDRSEE